MSRAAVVAGSRKSQSKGQDSPFRTAELIKTSFRTILVMIVMKGGNRRPSLLLYTGQTASCRWHDNAKSDKANRYRQSGE